MLEMPVVIGFLASKPCGYWVSKNCIILAKGRWFKSSHPDQKHSNSKGLKHLALAIFYLKKLIWPHFGRTIGRTILD